MPQGNLKIQYGVVLNFRKDWWFSEGIRDEWMEACKAVGCSYIVFQLEKGKRGRLHFQTFMQLLDRQRAMAVLRLLVEKMGCDARAIQIQSASVGLAEYCKKEDREEGPWEFGELRKAGRKRKSRDDELKEAWDASFKELKMTYDNVVWKDWQQEVLDIIAGPVDDRKIFWYWAPAPDGNVGKSFLFEYLACDDNIIIGGGATKQVSEMWYNHGPGVTTVIMDIPRGTRAINYVQMEKLKSGVFTTQMYGGKRCIQDRVHFIVFATREPATSCLSLDRWVIKRL